MSQRQTRPPGPQEMARCLSFEEVARHRNLTCGRYLMCLEVVVHRRWLSFTCLDCDLWNGARKHRPSRGPAVVISLPVKRLAQAAS